VEADPSRTSKSRRLMDIISMLVGIYGSKELFVNEYRVMLAEKLLNKTDYDTDRDIRTLELLKVHLKFIDKEKQTYN
jgi:anaphase-promoting complex subunit 2